MERIIVETTIENCDPSHTLRCDALVDTGEAYLTLPTAWRDRLGALTALATVQVQRDDPSTIQGSSVDRSCSAWNVSVPCWRRCCSSI